MKLIIGMWMVVSFGIGALMGQHLTYKRVIGFQEHAIKVATEAEQILKQCSR